MCGIQKTATCAGDTGGVGENEVGFVAGDLEVALQAAGVGVVDLMDDDAGTAAG